MFVTYPDVRYLSGCVLVAGGCGPAGDLHTGGAWWVLSGFARLLAVRAASFAWRVGSKPGQDSSLRINVARNSPTCISNVEFTSLGLQRFEVFSKTDRVKLRATYVWLVPCCRPPAPRQGPAGPAAASNRARLVAVRR